VALYIGGGTVLLLHGDGVDGSTTIVDSSSAPKTLTAVDGARISTAQSKFGGSSLYIPGTLGSRVDVENAGGVNLATGDFTIEGFFYPADIVAEGRPWAVGAYGTAWGCYGELYSNGTNCIIGMGRLNPYAAGICTYSTAKANIVNAWHHVAWVRRSGVAFIYLDGIQIATGACADNFTLAVRLRIGSLNYYASPDNFTFNYSYNGYIDEFRLTVGTALYTANFTPPTAPLGLIDPVQIQIQPLTSLGPPLAKYNPAIGQPVMQAITPDLTDRLPYGIPNTPIVGNVNPWEFKGRGRITGTVKNTPASAVFRKVALYRETDGLFVKAVWSNPATGAYEFSGINPNYAYTVLAYDHTETYRAVVADRVLPEAMP